MSACFSLSTCRLAQSTYTSQSGAAIDGVRRLYGVARPGEENIFTWLHRPDVARVAEMMTHYIPEWDYRVVSRQGGRRVRECTCFRAYTRTLSSL
jgi:hypothetical protein